MAQHTQLLLTLVHSLDSCNHLRCDLAGKLLLMICVEPGFRKEQVRLGGRGFLLTVCDSHVSVYHTLSFTHKHKDNE